MTWARNEAATQYLEECQLQYFEALYHHLQPWFIVPIDAVAQSSRSASLRACDASCVCFPNFEVVIAGSAKCPVSQVAG